MTDQNLSISEKIIILGEKLDQLNQEQTTEKIQEIKTQIQENTSSLALSDTRLETLETVLGIEGNNLNILGNLSAIAGTFSGNLEAKNISTNALSIKVDLNEPKTIGEAYICPSGFAGDACDVLDTSGDGTSVFVETSAVSVSAKIFITAENNVNGEAWIEKEADYSGFKIKINPETSITQPIKFNWWIVEEK